MAAEGDDALLFLIYQHLKVNGFHKAAKVLEKHVTQVRSLVQFCSFCGVSQCRTDPTWSCLVDSY